METDEEWLTGKKYLGMSLRDKNVENGEPVLNQKNIYRKKIV
jgi:hypothetical protein